MKNTDGKTDSQDRCLNFKNALDIRDFLNIKAISMETTQKLKDILNIKDETKQAVSEILLDRWMLSEIDGDSIYIKHVCSNRMNVLYQIILSGNEWDGIYEFVLKGKKISLTGYVVNDRNTLVIKSRGNYNLAMFGVGSDEPYSICRLDYETDEEFKKALLETGFVDEEDLEIYYCPDEVVKPYLDRILPRISF